MERRLAGLSAIKGWLDENSVEELYRRADYKKKHDVKGLVAECKNFAMLTSGIFGQDNVLMDVLARYHDVGRLAQYDLLGYEDDEKLSHNALGLDSLDRFIEANGIKVTPDIQVLRDVIYYHGRDIKGNLNISERSRRYIEQISAIEAIDNESIRTVFNLEKIIQNDYRGYNKEYPEYVGKIRSEIYSLFKNRDFGEKR